MSVSGDRDDLARIAFNLSPSGMVMVDQGGRIVTANREAERLFGWPSAELIGRPLETLVPERFRGSHPGHRSAFVADPRSRPMGAGRELHALRRDGTEFRVEIGLNPVTTPQGSFVLASVVDITARVQFEEELRRTQKLESVGILAGGIAHDFNNILLGIVGHTELALREPIAFQAREDLVQVLRAAERGGQLVRRILAFSREAEPARTPVRLERSVSEVVALMRASLPSTIDIQTGFDSATPTVMADETQLHQVLMNLATNAAHAMPSGGTLRIELRPIEIVAGEARSHSQPGAYARITVGDTGGGMPAEVLEHALEPFFTTKAPGQGTGLGLSVVHGIVSGHGGNLEITSTPGRGTSVTIDLPASTTPVETGAAAPAVAGEPHRLHVLFVDDEPVLTLMQRQQLQHLGFEVTAHTSSTDALADFRSRPDAFELLITDDTMPGMTGSDLAREISRIRPDLPVLMISGGDRTEPGKPKPAGVRRVLRKPHTVAELEQAIREVLGPGVTDPR